MAKSKKLTAVVAIGCAAVMTLSGTFAWILGEDETILNSFAHEIPDYGVKIEEDFEEWVNKDVTVKSTGASEAIVRVRFEEFLSIDGKTTDVSQQSGIYTATALADAVNPTDNDIRKDASKLNPHLVDLYFGEKFITMAEWTAMTTGVTGTALDDIYNEGWWVIDTDGWCYYTKALGNFEESNLSLSNALLNVTDSELKETYGAPVNLDYNINVRVQAISADLSDYGATDNPAQWSCETTGRVIDDDTNVLNEILTDTPVIAGSNADYLILHISGNNGYTFVTGNDDAVYLFLGSNAFRKVNYAIGGGYSVDETAFPILAGQDQIPGTADDNMLAGRSSAMGGSLRIANLNLTSKSYNIAEANAKYTVTAGLDGLLGTYDDVIKSSDADLGTYNISSTTEKENVGWEYLGGPLDNVFVISEYTLDSVIFNNHTKSNSNYYGDSILMAKMNEIATSMNVTRAKTVDLDMSVATDIAEYTAVPFNSASPTVEDQTLFAVSVRELVNAFGPLAEADQDRYFVAEMSPVDTNGAGKYTIYAGDLAFGTRRTFVTASYWLRSPGPRTDCAVRMFEGGVLARNTQYVYAGYARARPACYLDLSEN